MGGPKHLEARMDPSLWPYSIVRPHVELSLDVSPFEALVLGAAATGVLTAGAGCRRAAGPQARGAYGRRAPVTGWSDLFRFVGVCIRVVLLVVVGLLLLGRLLLWPMGRRWQDINGRTACRPAVVPRSNPTHSLPRSIFRSFSSPRKARVALAGSAR